MLGRSFAQFLQHVGKLTKTRIPLEAVVNLQRIFGIAKNDLDFSVAPVDGSGGSSHELEPADETENLSNDANANDRNANDADADDNGGASPHSKAALHLDGLAEILVAAAGGKLAKADALNWLLFTQPGRTFTHRHAALHKRRDNDDNDKDKDMTAKSHSLDNIVKRHGFVALAKSINAGSVTLTEEEYTKALVDDCARRGVSFEKVFCDTSPEGVEIRKGRERCRDTQFAKAGAGLMSLTPTQT